MEEKKQIITGNYNIQVGRDYLSRVTNIENCELLNPVFNIVQISLSEVKSFEKVLFSIEPENFLDEIIRPYLKNRPDTSIKDLKMLFNI